MKNLQICLNWSRSIVHEFFYYSVSVDKSDEFGICENKTAKELPAYIDYDNKELWDAVVKSHGVVDFNLPRV